ncbi:MAG TPA: hypothetical protein VK476_03245 [Flavobacterium sp.]|nr:hypothetical protein [Flavobacterium sp.]
MKLTILLFTFLFATNAEIEIIRQSYTDAAKSEESAKIFAEKVNSISDDDSNKVLVAYKGCSLTLKSKFSANLVDKISFMKQGAKLIDEAADAEPNNVEIRMIRLSVQENVPRIVNYRQNKDADKAFIIKHYKDLDADIKPFIKNFILQSKSFTPAQKKSVRA